VLAPGGDGPVPLPWQAARCVTVGYAAYLDGNGEPTGRYGLIWYAKTVLTDASPTTLQAFRERNNIFPATGTADQLFDEDRFVSYRDLGSYAAAQILDARAHLISIKDSSYDDLCHDDHWVAKELAALLDARTWHAVRALL
jgi:hypothetical protein